MSEALAGVGVLVTRPAQQADGLCAALAARGARAVRLPTIAIEPVATAALPADAAAVMARADRLLFVSPNAVSAGLAASRALGVELGGRIGAVGQGTARALREHGLMPTDVPADKSGARALLACHGLRYVTGERVVILRGEGGRAELADTLRARGAEVHELAVYRRARATANASEARLGWRAGWLRVTIATSGTGLEYLLELAGEQRNTLLGTRLVVVSERLAEIGRRAGFKTPIIVAATPGDPGLVEAASVAATTDRKHA